MVIIWSFVQAIFVRLLLFIHSFLCIWRAADVKNNHLFWFLGLGNVLHLVELEYRILKRRGEEEKWFCFCFFIHLLNTIPAIWILEFDRLEQYQSSTENTTVPITSNTTDDDGEFLSSLEGITIPVKLDASTWASVLEQGFLFILILGRWILPRGKLTRDQLSQLLFVYIGSGSDVMELFIIFEEPVIRADKTFSYAILAVWTWSLLQFTLVLTSTRKQRQEAAAVNADGKKQKRSFSEMPARCFAKMVEMEIWSLMVAIILQDLPYLTIRLCAISLKNVTSYGILFFASKNMLMLLMLFYRILVVGTHRKEIEKKNEEKIKTSKKKLKKLQKEASKIKEKGIDEDNEYDPWDDKSFRKKDKKFPRHTPELYGGFRQNMFYGNYPFPSGRYYDNPGYGYPY